MTTVFNNKTDAGHENAIRRGKVVPEDAVNLAYVQSPTLSPLQNIVIVDTSRIAEENAIDLGGRSQLYYANPMGVLEDENGNQVIDDEFPYVTDVFSIDEDYSVVPGSEYKAEHILPFVHVSRFFHLDWAGLVPPGGIIEWKEDVITVVDAAGRLFLTEEGKPRYKVRISSTTGLPAVEQGSQAAYRIYVYVDTNSVDELYLVYNKVEVGNNGIFKNQRVAYKELLNLKPIFEYLPEESEVVDRASYNRKVYSTKPVTLINQVLDRPWPAVDGYRVYVPKKAKVDPRIFQLFHWRVECDFISNASVDTTRFSRTVKCGVVVTKDNPQSKATFAFLNLEKSKFNPTGGSATGLQFENPLFQGAHNNQAKQRDDYWKVSFDSVTKEDLDKFDILIWAPTSPGVNFASPNYLPLIEYFTRTAGGTIFFDTSSFTMATGLNVTTSAGIHPASSTVINGATGTPVSTTTVTVDSTNVLMNANAEMGTWNILDGVNNDEIQSLSYIKQLFSPGYSQWIKSYGSEWTPIVFADGQPVTIQRATNAGDKHGNLIFSTFGHLYTCSAVFKTLPADTISDNSGTSAYVGGTYLEDINSPVVEGAMKFLFNVVALAVKGRALSDTNQTAWSSSWTHYTPWKSSWVINAANNTLSRDEIARYDFEFKNREDGTTENPVWKRYLSGRTCAELIEEALIADPVLRDRQRSSTRVYRVVATNKDVVKTTPIPADGRTRPTAWTLAYSPRFEIPIELGPNVVRAEERVGEYQPEKYEYVTYPSKSYAGIVQATYADTSETLDRKHINWKATGTCDGVVEELVGEYQEGYFESSPSTQNVTLSWWANPQRWSGADYIENDQDGGGVPYYRSYIRNTAPWRFGYLQPVGIASWQDHNYKGGAAGNAHLNWPYVGFTQLYATYHNNNSEVNMFIREAMNEFHRRGYFTSSKGELPINQSFNADLDRVITDFQTRMQARFIDGIVDAETWSLIGYQILRTAADELLTGRPAARGYGRGGHWRFFDYPYAFLPLHHVSNRDLATTFAKRSWFAEGSKTKAPAAIWDYLQISFDGAYAIHGITITPYVEGAADSIIVSSIKVSGAFPMYSYLGGDAEVQKLIRVPRDQEYYIPFGPYTGDTLTVGIGQDRRAGGDWGVALMMGVRDIVAHAEVPSTKRTWIEPRDTRHMEPRTYTIAIECSGSLDVTSFEDKTQQAEPHLLSSEHRTFLSLSNYKWTGLTWDIESGVIATMSESGLITFRSRSVARDVSGQRSVSGPHFPRDPLYPSQSYRSMTIDGKLNPLVEIGQVSQSEGVKLLCDVNGKPWGFPDHMPIAVGANEAQRHFTMLTLIPEGNDKTVHVSFYDKLRGQFIQNAEGKPEMSYIEWMSRNPENVYVAVHSTYNEPASGQTPIDSDAPKLPYRWAMPVYGVYRHAGSRITLEPLPPKLGLTDVWPIAVRDGRFTKMVTIRARSDGYLTTYLKDYQGTTVRAFYSIPDGGGWSTLYGPPMADIVGEEPIILDDDVIQVRQSPIHLVSEPTIVSSFADPVRPAFTYYKRPDVNSPWVAQPWSEIRDYNSKTGEIFLTTPIQTEDPSLLKVDYTTKRRHYYFKRSGNQILNLNPYPGYSRDLMGKAIYVYLLPQYVKDTNNAIIASSYTSEPLRFTTTPEVFDPLRPEYDPLAVLLGVIYISTSLDITELMMMDTRIRGGGIREELNASEVIRLIQESSTYWDIHHAAGSSYQRAGFIVVRLPAALKNDFTESEIVDVVERNITSGVKFRLEDFSGKDWSLV